MTDKKAALSLRYYLNLEESQDGFALATFGKKQLTRFITPAISIGIIIWGISLGIEGVGRYYVALGAFFLLLQLLMRYWLLPMLFKRQFVKYQFGKSEQGIDLYQHHAELYNSGRAKKVVHYHEVKKFAEGKLTYMLELNNRTVVVVPKRAFASSEQQDLFKHRFATV
ncbi:YcxB family protein [Acinetobacter larvae]|uniref:YcxB-like C-terminal domain-containing protein n=1 Tax=Acinetobacter larvae TaxID=1789224 RepID=A0A1B2M484_9GAMM|nr:YcxB family protein [Acinetobacter larvae]AOA60020.1 hypothetical protein BFG52_14455 [Acinetobacter larvae]